jgi:hypothetical protein
MQVEVIAAVVQQQLQQRKEEEEEEEAAAAAETDADAEVLQALAGLLNDSSIASPHTHARLPPAPTPAASHLCVHCSVAIWQASLDADVAPNTAPAKHCAAFDRKLGAALLDVNSTLLDANSTRVAAGDSVCWYCCNCALAENQVRIR